MQEQRDLILHVYKLGPAENTQRGFLSSSWSLLPSIGLGTYHTCLEFDGSCYSFAANVGVVRTSAKRREAQGIPTGASFQESILLGDCPRGSQNALLSKLEPDFGPRSYHLIHRNCNHFTETLATALCLADGFPCPKYPTWINRLAKTSKHLVGHDEDIVPCDPIREARKAAGLDDKGGWDFTSSKKKPSKKTSRSEKKQLTEKQKAALAKIRAGKK